MARQGINTGSAPDAGDGDSLLIGALKINDNFSEIYTTLGDGNNITNSIGFASTSGISTYSNLSRVVIKDSGSTVGTAGTIDFGNNLTVSAISAGIVTVTATSSSDSQWQSTAAGIHTLSNVGVGTTNPTSALTVQGDISVSGVVTANNFVTPFGSGQGFAVYSNPGPFQVEVVNLGGYYAEMGYRSYISSLYIGGALKDSATVGNAWRIFNTGQAFFSSTVSSDSGFIVGDPSTVNINSSGINAAGIITASKLNISGDYIVLPKGTDKGIIFGEPPWDSPSQESIIFKSDSEGVEEELVINNLGNGVRIVADEIYLFTSSTKWSSISSETSYFGGYNNSSLVGIGSTQPKSKLDVSGNASVSGNLSVSGVSTFNGGIVNTGGLLIESDNEIELKKKGTNDTLALFTPDSSVELYYDGDKTFETLGAGVTVTGTTFTNQLSVSGVGTFGGNNSGAIDVKDNSGGRTYISPGAITFNAETASSIQLISNTQYFRAGSNGTSAYYFSNYYGGSDKKIFYVDSAGPTEIYYGEGNKRLETLGAGVTVTGTTFTNQLSVSGVSTFTGSARVGVDTSAGIILTSPNGTKYQLFVEDDGTLNTVSV